MRTKSAYVLIMAAAERIITMDALAVPGRMLNYGVQSLILQPRETEAGRTD